MGPTTSKISSWLGRVLRGQAVPSPEQLRIVNRTRQTGIGDRIEVADRGERRRKGLLGRTGLAPGEGLWIVPCEAVHTFGMKFAIDLIFLDRKWRVVKVRHAVRSGRISGSLRAHSVVELPAGTVRASLTETGDQLDFEPVSA
ncbi:MAG TPA: DUF192 domain-containing protein [Terracidiphilus sp.]|nr:DUF192 domain-containing protein [Terracidiphilus sp.]